MKAAQMVEDNRTGGAADSAGHCPHLLMNSMDDFPLDGRTYLAENEAGECFIVKWSAEFPHEWIVPIPDGSAAIVHRDDAKLVRWCPMSRPHRGDQT